MWAVILVGGFGTRLQEVLPNVPKPMAPINGKPFLAYLLSFLRSQGVTNVVFSVHYLREQIQTYFKTQYEGMTVHYAVEDEPLGTGGAILNAISLVPADKPFFALNGDTFVKLDYQAFYQQQQNHRAALTIALRSVEDCSRYGKVLTAGNEIIAFNEKGEKGPGFINAGVYLIHPSLFSQFNLPSAFSFEKDFMLPFAAKLEPQAFFVHDYFIDIGIPDDYVRAQLELPRLGV